MEFELEYNTITNKNKNLFYFNNYCTDYKEFRDWLEYNEITIEEFKTLNEYVQDEYLKYKANHIIDSVEQCLKANRNCFQDKLNIMENYYNICHTNLYYIEFISNMDTPISSIFSEFINDMNEIKEILEY